MVFFSKLVRIVKSTNIVWHLTDPLQFLHPLEAEGYRETVRAIRTIGRDCIQKRIRTIESGEQPPNDILSHILQVGK